MRPNPVQDLDASIYAQMRTFHFLKWNKSAPEGLLKECGPECHSYALGGRIPMVLPTCVKVRMERREKMRRDEKRRDEMRRGQKRNREEGRRKKKEEVDR